ncbi:Z1 domain-containing protein [Halomonas sp. H5]|uniref:Z1 domain-containing protein n=1 Tax=Halomonas sp. H5 TaxID=3423910 RepID=UPI003D36F6F8
MTEDKDKVFQRVVSIAQTLLADAKEQGVVTPGLIADQVEVAAGVMAKNTEIDKNAVVAELIRRFSLWIGKDTTLSDNKGHMAWLTAARRRDWRYWQRYESMLESKLSLKAVEALDESTGHILGLLEDPKREGRWDRRGLVVGHVQSGKTGNYTGLVCKAADAGYKIIIVLAGLHNNLRSQTQIRLEEGFLGYETSSKGDSVKAIGVGKIDSDVEIRPNCATNRANSGDFSTKVAKHYAITPEQRPWLFVVKKNKTVLERLLKWIRNHVADTKDTDGRPLVSNLPLLLIDDEADHASVDTGEQLFNPDGTPDEEHQPKTINRLIRKILHSFAKKAYVGYTATPFANIFIHRHNETKDEGPDLFPQSFIINLSAPSNYVGPARVFGLRSPEGRVRGLPLSREVDDHVDAEGTGGWMPPKHPKDHIPLQDGRDELPPSLREAVGAFVLSCAVRKLRGQGNRHSSMLIHVTRYTLVQEEVRRQVEELVKLFRQRVERGLDRKSLVAEWQDLWENDFVPTSAHLRRELADAEAEYALPEWDNVVAILNEVLRDIEVRAINGTAKDALDYAENEETGLKVIAIGGDKLARGLTLEGLCISYFVRTTKMYDTLMQMGRWFGYRPGYTDLCRLYTSSDLIDWFGHIADAAEELRQEFDHMAAVGATPWEYGLKVESHPILLVTSPLKMRTAKTLSLSYSGSLVQTVSFLNDSESLERNLLATTSLVTTMNEPSERGPRRQRGNDEDVWKRSYLWNRVPSETVLDFFRSYRTPPGADRANSDVIADFVSQMNQVGELHEWTVALLAEGKTGESFDFSPFVTVSSLPSRTDKGVSGRYTIGVLTDPVDEAIDLGASEWLAALTSTCKEWKPDPARNRLSEPKRPSGQSIREQRGMGLEGAPSPSRQGLLMIYPLSYKGAEPAIEDWNRPIIGFAVSFPSSKAGIKVDYKVDHRFWENEYGPAD